MVPSFYEFDMRCLNISWRSGQQQALVFQLIAPSSVNRWRPFYPSSYRLTAIDVPEIV
jgi:hypothetical protein